MPASKELSVYLQDHMSGSVVGHELARRAARENRGTEYGEVLDRIATEIGEDRDALDRLMRLLDVPRRRLKEAGAWTGEKLSRLKLNGRVVGYSPLSRLVELEALMLGVTGKLGLWTALQESGAVAGRTGEIDLEDLIARAASQRDRLEALRRRAATEALRPHQADPASSPRTPQAT